jgi:hypothetical protein
MRNFVNFTWVNNVNNLRVETGIRSGVLSPVGVYTQNDSNNIHGKLSVVHFIYHLLQTLLSTRFFHHLYLLKRSFTHYPHPLLIEPQMKN